jgi:hypothetical protein
MMGLPELAFGSQWYSSSMHPPHHGIAEPTGSAAGGDTAKETR